MLRSAGDQILCSQASDGVMAMIPKLIYEDLPAGVEAFYLSDYLANTVADNAVANTTSFTPFRGANCRSARFSTPALPFAMNHETSTNGRL